MSKTKLKTLLTESTTMSGTVTLYHYTDVDQCDVAPLAPKEAFKHQHYYSQKEMQRSSFPRVFYYTDLKKTEKQVTSAIRTLYSGSVNGSKILRLQDAINEYHRDKETFAKNDPKAYYVVNALFGNPHQPSGDWDAMFQAASEKFDGLYYDGGGSLPIVALLIPLKCKKIER